MFTALLIGLLLVLIGVAFTLYGYRLFVFLLPIWGFVVGFLFGAQIISSIFGNGLLSTAIGWIVGFGVGILVAILSYFIYSFGVYMLAATFGLGIGVILLSAIGIESNLLIAIVAIGVAIVMIALVGYLDLKKWLIVFVTAFGGSLGFVTGVLIALGTVSLSAIQSGSNPVTTAVSDSMFWIILWGVLGITGIVYQARTTKEFFQSEDYDYYHQLANQKMNEAETTIEEKEIDQEAPISGDADVSDSGGTVRDEPSDSNLEKNVNEQDTIDEISAKEITSDDEYQQDDSIKEDEVEDRKSI